MTDTPKDRDDEGLREAAIEALNTWRGKPDGVMALIHAREAALRAERDAALAALAYAEKRCETMREALENARFHLEQYEIERTGEVYHNPKINAALRRARAATGAER